MQTTPSDTFVASVCLINLSHFFPSFSDEKIPLKVSNSKIRYNSDLNFLNRRVFSVSFNHRKGSILEIKKKLGLKLPRTISFPFHRRFFELFIFLC